MTRKLSLPAVTRVEVIDSTGRAFTRHYDLAGASVSVQDDGRTVKVFASEPQPDGEDLFPKIQELVAEALREAPSLLDNPEYGGSLVDVISDHVYTQLSAEGILR